MKKTSALKPYYPHQPIGSVDGLARALGVHPKILRDIAKKASASYTMFEIQSSSGKVRTVFEPKFELKKIQKRINARLMEHVIYPRYLMGSIKDEAFRRDYVENAAAHSGSSTLVKLDIKNFFTNICRQQVEDVYQYFFKFPDDVASLLTDLTTLNGRVPQGGCTSSYIANLVFFNAEYEIVSRFGRQGLTYTRLLDDVTVSSKVELKKEDITGIITAIAGMCKKHSLKLNSKKTVIENSRDFSSSFMVTGVCTRHNVPKLIKKDRRYVRQLVYITECEAKRTKASDEYHQLWNRASGQVAKLTRLDHSQSSKLRQRLRDILPVFDERLEKKLVTEVKKLTNKSQIGKSHRFGHIKRVNSALNQIGILSRTNKPLATSLRSQLSSCYRKIPSIADYWNS